MMINEFIKSLKKRLPGLGEMSMPQKEAYAARCLLAEKWSAITIYSPKEIDRYLCLLKMELDMACLESREVNRIRVIDG